MGSHISNSIICRSYFHSNIAPNNPIIGDQFHQWNFQIGNSVEVSAFDRTSVGKGVGVAVTVGVGVGVAVGVDVGSSVGVGVGVAVGLIVTIGVIGTGVGVAIGATFVLPPHITMEEYEQDEPVQPSLQITCPFPCAPAEQLTPPWPEQQPLVASTVEARKNEAKNVNAGRRKSFFIVLLDLAHYITPCNSSCYNFPMAGKIQRYYEAKTKKSITFVYFDVGGVMLDFSYLFTKLANLLNASADDVYDFWIPHDDSLNLGTLSPVEFWRQIKTHFSYRGQDIDFVDFCVTSVRPIKEIHSFVRKISKTRKIGLITNAMFGSIAKNRELGYIPRANFSAIIESNTLGIIKPDPKIFTIAQRRAGVEAGEILFIDDTEKNVLQANKSGFHAYHFDTNNPSGSVEELTKLLR